MRFVRRRAVPSPCSPSPPTPPSLASSSRQSWSRASSPWSSPRASD